MNSKSFGAKISAFRKSKGMTQAQLAEILNVSNKTISRWETGEGYPEITLLAPLAEALGVTVDQLLNESEKADDTTGANTGSNEKTYYYNGQFSNADSASASATGEKKAPHHEEIPICWSSLKSQIKEFGVLQFLYFFAGGMWFYSCCSYYTANLSGTFGSNESGYLCSSTLGYIVIAIAIIATVLMLLLNLYKKKRGRLDKVKFSRNIIMTVIFACGLLLSLGYYNATLTQGGYQELYNVSKGSIFNCQYIAFNRPLIVAFTCIFSLTYVVWELIFALKNRRSQDLGFWKSLTLFNKIAFVCVELNVALMLLMFILNYFMPGSIVATGVVLILVSSLSSKVGLISALIGLGAGLIDKYDKQTKGSIIFALINFIMVYLPAVIVGVGGFITFTGMGQTMTNDLWGVSTVISG